jgi:N,N'-diacetyllegionaminate synthase
MRFEIAGRRIGVGEPLFVIAEIGLNHDGSVDRALTLVDEAAKAGADAIKLQSLYADKLVAAHCPAPLHVRAQSLRELFAHFELDEAAHAQVARRARKQGLVFMSTPFDEAAVDMLERLGCEAFKIASGDLTHLPLIERVARTGKPMIMSTGMSTLQEVREAVDCARAAGARTIALLHCVSAYPTPQDQQNLAAIRTLADTFGLPVGLSDHSSGSRESAVTIATAVALGARLYERHIKSEKDGHAIDEAVSSSARQFAAAIAAAEMTRRALGHGRREPQPAERGNVEASRRALYATRDLQPGDFIGPADVIALRPATGLAPKHRAALIGLRVQRDIAAGEPFTTVDLPGTLHADSDSNMARAWIEEHARHAARAALARTTRGSSVKSGAGRGAEGDGSRGTA